MAMASNDSYVSASSVTQTPGCTNGHDNFRTNVSSDGTAPAQHCSNWVEASSMHVIRILNYTYPSATLARNIRLNIRKQKDKYKLGFTIHAINKRG